MLVRVVEAVETVVEAGWAGTAGHEGAVVDTVVLAGHEGALVDTVVFAERAGLRAAAAAATAACRRHPRSRLHTERG